jgi:tetratricopeptide (TPR) repeat protein
MRAGIPGIWLAFGLALMLATCADRQSVDVETATKIAGELRSNKLYSAAIDEYRSILDNPSLDSHERGNLNYLIARIYFEDMHDYRNAAAYYVRARAVAPDAPYSDEASRNLIVSLEKMGQTIDALRELKSATAVDSDVRKTGDSVVAIVGDKTIYTSDIEERIQSLPGDMQSKLANRADRVEYARRLAGVELLHRAALREGYDQEPEIRRQVDDYARSLVVDRFLRDKVMKDMTIDTVDVRTYYLAHQEDRYNGMPYDSIRAAVLLDYQQEKADAAYTRYLQKLASAERFEFYEKNVQ